MRRNLTLIIVVLGLTNLSYSQKDTIPKHYELKGQAYFQADSILDVWMDTQYPILLKKNKLKMTCAHCTNIFMDVIFLIGNDGRVDDAKVVQTVKCGGEFSDKLQLDFLMFFENFIFPLSLRNQTIQFRFGTGLKC